MVFDLRGALLKKEERESARLAEFEFRQRARTMRLLAARVGMTAREEEFVALIARTDDEGVLHALRECFPDQDCIEAEFNAARHEARRQLIDELGDPTPHRLA